MQTWSPLACQAAPKTLESAFVARKPTDIGMGKGTLVEAPLPRGNGRDRCVLWPPHRSCAHDAAVREIPVGRDGELRFLPRDVCSESERGFSIARQRLAKPKEAEEKCGRSSRPLFPQVPKLLVVR
jgi:hypothetical protein